MSQVSGKTGIKYLLLAGYGIQGSQKIEVTLKYARLMYASRGVCLMVPAAKRICAVSEK